MTQTPPVILSDVDDVRPLRNRSLEAVEDARTVDEMLAAAARIPGALRPGGVGTLALWEVLATVAARDLALARALEPHLDAVAILEQSSTTPSDLAAVVEHPARATWGVFAAEAPGLRVEAQPAADGTARLTGTKPWCSLADRLSAALMTAHLPGGGRGLFAVDLRHAGVAVSDEPWAARGLVEISSTSVTFTDVPAAPVGEPGWYLSRPGFAWGGAGVAACWYGGAVGLARTMAERLEERSDADLLMMHLGDVDEHLRAARAVLAETATAVSRGEPTKTATARARATVARTCERVLRASAHALGPAPLTLDADHAKRVADLEIYVRQHHAERDLASLGRAALAAGAPW